MDDPMVRETKCLFKDTLRVREGASQLGPEDNRKKTGTILGTQGVWSLLPRVHTKEFEPTSAYAQWGTLKILIGRWQHQPYFLSVIWLAVCRTD